MKFLSMKQKKLFDEISQCGELIFACGPKGVSANMVGQFSVRKNHRGEDQLNVDDGTHHVHIDWKRIKRFSIGDFHGEGVITFYDDEKPMFKLYRMEGPYPSTISSMEGLLIDE